MQKKVEEMIPKALAEANKIADGKTYIDKEFKGYVSSFGSAIITSGLIPAVAFFSEKGGASKERQKIIDAIFNIAFPDERNAENHKLLDYVIKAKNENRLDSCKIKIINATIALKLAIRTFKSLENQQEEEV